LGEVRRRAVYELCFRKGKTQSQESRIQRRNEMNARHNLANQVLVVG
jgi:hypothetical protein